MLPQIPPSFALRRKPFDRLCPKSLNYEDKRPAAQIEPPAFLLKRFVQIQIPEQAVGTI